MNRLAPGLALLTVLATGCGFWNWGYDGHPCGPDGTCLSGYACNASNVCVVAAAASCTPACDETHTCVKQHCVSKCDGVACEPASVCQADAGTCAQLMTTESLGAPCMQDSDCNQTDSSLRCLLPYGGQLAGVCTAVCSSSNSSICTASGQACTSFTSDAPGSSIQLCADPSLKPCAKDSDCNSATSDFTCVVAAVNTPNFGTVSASVCAPPVAGSLPPGQSCTFSGPPCASGLCVQKDNNVADRYCSTPCSTTTDCQGLFAGVDPSMLNCEPVTIALQALTNRTRANLCIIGAPSYGVACGSTGGSICTADAPNCVMNAAGTSEVCAPYCTDGLATLQCSTTEGSQLTCDKMSETCH